MMSHSVPPISITNGSTDIISYLEIVITGIKHFRKYFDRRLVQSSIDYPECHEDIDTRLNAQHQSTYMTTQWEYAIHNYG